MNDRPHNKDLEELLKDLKTKKSEGLDDFEREALEGFDTLDSKEEALNLKSDLDKRIHEELFSEKKKDRNIYWFAAAGLFLVIGFSVYLILYNKTIKEKDVALVPAKEMKHLEVEKTESAPAEESAPAAIAGEKTADKQRLIAGKKEERKEEKKSEGQVSSRAILKPMQKANENLSPSAEVSAIDKRDDADKVAKTEEANKAIAKDANLDDLKQSGEVRNEESFQAKETVSDNLSLAETKINDRETTKKASVYRAKNKRKEGVKKEAEEDEAKLASEKSPASGATAGGYVSQPVSTTIASNNNTTPKSSIDTKSSATPAYNEPGKPQADDYNSPTNTCYYVGGPADLTKDVREKLIEKDVNKKFDVILNINEKKQVEKVNYLNVYDLTTDQRNKVTEILKALSKFNFYIQPNTKSLYQFKLLYRP